MFQRLVRLVWGIAYLGFWGSIFLALMSYTSTDPSWNTRTAIDAANWMGAWGSYVSDFCYQTFGIVSYALLFHGLVWGIWMVWDHLPRAPRTRWTLCVLGVLMLCGGLSLCSSPWFLPVTVPAGGVLGVLVIQSVDYLTASVIPSWLLTTLLFILGLVCYVISLGISARRWMSLFRLIKKGASAAVPVMAAKPIMPVKAFMPEKHPSPLKFPPDEPTPKREEITSLPTVEAPAQPVARKAAPPRALPLGDEEYRSPPHELLTVGKMAVRPRSEAELQGSATMLASVLEDFGVKGDISKISPGPVVTLYELKPAPGTKSSRIIGLSDDIARSMSAVSTRISVIPGYNALGIELPNVERQIVYLRELLEHPSFTETHHKLPLILGKEIGGQPIVVDLAKMPHLLVAGTTGSGKSVSINVMILSLLFRLSPQECKFIMIDPKMLELSVYDKIPHLLTPVVTDPQKAVVALKWAVREMERRYQIMSKLGVRNVDGYNQRIREAKESGEVLSRQVQVGFHEDTGEPLFENQPIPLEALPYIVIIVDEMADLMLVAGKDIEGAVQRLAQMARAAGLHLIMATQRPSVDVITGTIKANFPTRISFQVSSKIDSRTILGEQGAEQLLGHGDMLYVSPGGRMLRVHGPLVADREVEHIADYLRSLGEPDYIETIAMSDGSLMASEGGSREESGDLLYDQAVALVAREKKASTSFIQRHLQIGYNRAARIVERMEQEGVVSQANHVGKREVLVNAHD